MEQAKRLYRNRYDTVIAGVAGGLAKYFNIDPIIARIVFVVLAFTGGGGLVIYIILWIALPVDPDLSFHSYNFKNAYQNPEPAATDQPFDAGTGEESKNETGAGSENYGEKYKPYADYEKKQGDGNLIAGIVLIVIGGLFLATRFISHISFRDLWPVLLIVGGILILKSSLTKPKNNN
jgi:phage shock protein PspC (stress-responsive transcriptional regulator)